MKPIVCSPLARASPGGGGVIMASWPIVDADPYFNAHNDPFDGSPHGLLAALPKSGECKPVVF